MPKIKDRRGIALENEDKPRPTFTVLPGGKRDDEPPDLQGPQTLCLHCVEHQREHELAETRKFARQSGWLRVDENARLRRAKSRGGKLLD
jgi:hypothetical protein